MNKYLNYDVILMSWVQYLPLELVFSMYVGQTAKDVQTTRHYLKQILVLVLVLVNISLTGD